MNFHSHHYSPISPYPHPHPGMQKHADWSRTINTFYYNTPEVEAQAFPTGAQQIVWSMSRPQHHTTASLVPLSLFAQTLKELDDEFYATFPAAKQAAIEIWQFQQAQIDTCPPTFDVEAIYDSEACQPYPENIRHPNASGGLNAHRHYPAYIPTASLQPRPHEAAYNDGQHFISASPPVHVAAPFLAPEFPVPSNHIVPTQQGPDTEAGVVSLRRSTDIEAPSPSPPDSGQFAYPPLRARTAHPL
ncbi:hypothetical protein BD779DRAFT_1242471 [Infundibulicybe gibba]|nr:hypothetical protein BD779DRAFT_1242471 [Infundibulicybe gibba]